MTLKRFCERYDCTGAERHELRLHLFWLRFRAMCTKIEAARWKL